MYTQQPRDLAEKSFTANDRTIVYSFYGKANGEHKTLA